VGGRYAALRERIGEAHEPGDVDLHSIQSRVESARGTGDVSEGVGDAADVGVEKWTWRGEGVEGDESALSTPSP
jgi:hypothetical protein